MLQVSDCASWVKAVCDSRTLTADPGLIRRSRCTLPATAKQRFKQPVVLEYWTTQAPPAGRAVDATNQNNNINSLGSRRQPQPCSRSALRPRPRSVHQWGCKRKLLPSLWVLKLVKGVRPKLVLAADQSPWWVTCRSISQKAATLGCRRVYISQRHR